MRPSVRDGGSLVCVFGAGGDRDPGKRPEMGRIAASLADRVVVTSDNPRSEDPTTIAMAIAQGVRAAGNRHWILEVDRAKAIRGAIAAGRAGDVIVLAGKGHETYPGNRRREAPVLGRGRGCRRAGAMESRMMDLATAARDVQGRVQRRERRVLARDQRQPHAQARRLVRRARRRSLRRTRLRRAGDRARRRRGSRVRSTGAVAARQPDRRRRHACRARPAGRLRGGRGSRCPSPSSSAATARRR